MRTEPRCGSRTSDEGSVLLLMPAAVLIVMVLGAIAVDAAVVYLGERQAADLAASIANDAAALLDDAAYYRDDRVCLPAAELAAYAARRLAAADGERFRIVHGTDPGDPAAPAHSELVVIDDCQGLGTDPRLEASVVAEVPLIFSRALPGPDLVVVDASSRVRLAAG